MFSTLKSVFTKPSQRYTKVACFTVNTGTLHALAISNDGEILAAGGAEGVKFWNIRSRKEVPCSSPAHDGGAVSCATWIKTRHNVTETLCYGTGRGYLVFLRRNPVDKLFQEICARRLGSGFEVTCITWDASWSEGGSRIAVGMRDNVIQVLQLNSNTQLQSIFAGRLNNTVPKSIAFADHGDLYIFGLFDGNVVKMSVPNGIILSEHQYESVIGCAAISLRKSLVVVDNATNGFTLYRLDRADPIRTYLTDPPAVPVPKQVAFGEDSKIVAGGSDNGSVYIFERKSGKLLETLRHSKNGLVQAIAVRDVGGQCIIASVSPVAGRKKVAIKVWTHKYVNRKLSTGHGNHTISMSTLRILTQFVILVSLLVGAIFFFAGVSRSVVEPGAVWNGVLPQVSRWYSKFNSIPEDPVAAFKREAQIFRASKENKAPLGGKKLGSKNDIEILEELAQHLTRMGIVWAGADQADEEASEDVGGAKSSPEDANEIPIIYL